MGDFSDVTLASGDNQVMWFGTCGRPWMLLVMWPWRLAITRRPSLMWLATGRYGDITLGNEALISGVVGDISPELRPNYEGHHWCDSSAWRQPARYHCRRTWQCPNLPINQKLFTLHLATMLPLIIHPIAEGLLKVAIQFNPYFGISYSSSYYSDPRTNCNFVLELRTVSGNAPLSSIQRYHTTYPVFFAIMTCAYIGWTVILLFLFCIHSVSIPVILKVWE